MPKIINLLELEGKRIERIVILSSFRNPLKAKKIFCNCLCDCGNEKIIAYSDLMSGNTRSCGCLSLELSLARFTTHGSTADGNYPLEYRSRARAISRCYDKNDPSYKHYGGRGIEVCQRWLGRDGYSNFISDMGKRPTPKHSIDRINVNGNYEPSNCRWATIKQQANNKRNNRIIELNGQKKTINEWADFYGIKITTVRNRYYRDLKNGTKTIEQVFQL